MNSEKKRPRDDQEEQEAPASTPSREFSPPNQKPEVDTGRYGQSSEEAPNEVDEPFIPAVNPGLNSNTADLTGDPSLRGGGSIA